MAEQSWMESLRYHMKREDTIYDKKDRMQIKLSKLLEEKGRIERALERLEDSIANEQVGSDDYRELLPKIQQMNGRLLEIEKSIKKLEGKIQYASDIIKHGKRVTLANFNKEMERIDKENQDNQDEDYDY